MAATSVDWKITDLGERLASCSDDRSIRVYDPKNDEFNLLSIHQTSGLYFTYLQLQNSRNEQQKQKQKQKEKQKQEISNSAIISDSSNSNSFCEVQEPILSSVLSVEKVESASSAIETTTTATTSESSKSENNEAHVCCCTEDGLLHMWRLSDGEHVLKFKLHAGSVEGLSWNAQQNLIATCGSECSIMITQAGSF